MLIIENQTFLNEVVELDGTHFSDCTFIGCIFEYHGGDVSFERTEIRECRHVFYGRARQSGHSLQHTGVPPLDPFEGMELSDTVN